MHQSLPPPPNSEDQSPVSYDQVLAGELALGLLEGDEAAEAAARLAADPAFAAELRDWQERLAMMALELTPVMAPARARQRVREQLGHAVAPLSLDPLGQPSRRPLALWLVLLLAAGLAAWWFLTRQP